MTFEYMNRSLLSVDMPSWAYIGNGVQLLVDGDMEAAGVAAWLVLNGATLTKSVVNPHSGTQALRITYNGTANPGAAQNPAAMIAGRTYRITGWARGDGGLGIPSVSDSAGPGSTWLGTNSTTWQYFDRTIVAIGGSMRFYGGMAGAGWVEFDDVFLELMPASTRNLGSLGGTVQLGDGTTVGTFPTQVFPHGMSFDGGDYLLRASEAALSFTAGAGIDLPFSIECLAITNSTNAGLVAKGSWGTTGEYGLWVGGGSAVMMCIGAVQADYIGRISTAGRYGNSRTVCHFVGTYDASKASSGIAVYGNGVRCDTANYAGGAYTGMSNLGAGVTIGNFGGAVIFTGAIFNAAIYPFALQPGEVAQLAAMRRAMINRGY